MLHWIFHTQMFMSWITETHGFVHVTDAVISFGIRFWARIMKCSTWSSLPLADIAHYNIRILKPNFLSIYYNLISTLKGRNICLYTFWIAPLKFGFRDTTVAKLSWMMLSTPPKKSGWFVIRNWVNWTKFCLKNSNA